MFGLISYLKAFHQNSKAVSLVHHLHVLSGLATGRDTFPSTIGNVNLNITANIVASDIPLLFSRESLAKAGLTLQFEEHD